MCNSTVPRRLKFHVIDIWPLEDSAVLQWSAVGFKLHLHQRKEWNNLGEKKKKEQLATGCIYYLLSSFPFHLYIRPLTETWIKCECEEELNYIQTLTYVHTQKKKMSEEWSSVHNQIKNKVLTIIIISSEKVYNGKLKLKIACENACVCEGK